MLPAFNFRCGNRRLAGGHHTTPCSPGQKFSHSTSESDHLHLSRRLVTTRYRMDGLDGDTWHRTAAGQRTETCQVGPRCCHGESPLVGGSLGGAGAGDTHGSWIRGPQRFWLVKDTGVWCGGLWSFAVTVIPYRIGTLVSGVINSQMHLSLSMITADSKHL